MVSVIVVDFLLVANLVVTALLGILMGAYHVRYFWWRSVEGRIVMGGLFSALLVTVGGLFERYGNIEVHNWFKSLGYLGASVVLLAATRHVIRMQNGHAEQTEAREYH